MIARAKGRKALTESPWASKTSSWDISTYKSTGTMAWGQEKWTDNTTSGLELVNITICEGEG